MPSISTVPNRKGTPSSVDLRKFAPPDMVTRDAFSLAPAQGNIFNDLTQGVLAGATITGPTRARPAGKDIAVAGWVSAAGTVTIETSSDGGTTWPNTDSEAIPAGEYVVARAVPVGAATHYRLKFTCGPVAASKVFLSSQARS